MREEEEEEEEEDPPSAKSVFFLSSRQAGAIKGFCLSDWRCKCGFDGKFLMAGQRQWECWSVACWDRGWENK